MVVHPAENLLASEWSKYAWVIGSFVQQDLKTIEGVKITSPKYFQEKENLSLLKAVERYNRIFCPEVDFASRKIYVSYKDKRFEIGKLVIEIIKDCWIGGEWESFGNRIGGDIRSIDVEKAYKLVAVRIVQPILDGKLSYVGT